LFTGYHLKIVPIKTIFSWQTRTLKLIRVAALLPLGYTLISSHGTINRYEEKTRNGMSDQSPAHCKSANLKKALVWMSETLQQHPGKKRPIVLQEAELRFDLTPLECAFLDKHFSAPPE